MMSSTLHSSSGTFMRMRCSSRTVALSPMHASPRSCTCLQAKKTATRETVLESTEEAVNPTDLLTPYDALDDEGNPWWSPPDRDFWEGGAWDWLGRGASFVLPTLLALALITGIISLATYFAPELPPTAESPPQMAKSDGELDLMLGGDDSDVSEETGGQKDIAPF